MVDDGKSTSKTKKTTAPQKNTPPRSHQQKPISIDSPGKKPTTRADNPIAVDKKHGNEKKSVKDTVEKQKKSVVVVKEAKTDVVLVPKKAKKQNDPKKKTVNNEEKDKSNHTAVKTHSHEDEKQIEAKEVRTNSEAKKSKHTKVETELITPPMTGALMTSIPHGTVYDKPKPGYVNVKAKHKHVEKTDIDSESDNEKENNCCEGKKVEHVNKEHAKKSKHEESGDDEKNGGDDEKNSVNDEKSVEEEKHGPVKKTLSAISSDGKAIGTQMKKDKQFVREAYKEAGFFPNPNMLPPPPRPLRPSPHCEE